MRVLTAALLLYLAYCAVGFALQRWLLFPGASMSPFRPIDIDTVPGVEQVWFENGGGRSEAWFLPAEADGSDGPRPVVIFLHGNGEFIDDWLEALRPVTGLGAHLLLLEYPGYGRSTGAPSEKSILRSTFEAYDWLAAEPRVDPERVLAMGRSLGGGPATRLAAERPVAALILQSTFTSVGAMAARAYWVPPFLVRDRFESLPAIRSFPGPVLVMHGEDDRIVPFAHGARIAAASPRAELVPLACGHNDCPPSWPEFWSLVGSFLEREGLLGEG